MDVSYYRQPLASPRRVADLIRDWCCASVHWGPPTCVTYRHGAGCGTAASRSAAIAGAAAPVHDASCEHESRYGEDGDWRKRARRADRGPSFRMWRIDFHQE